MADEHGGAAESPLTLAEEESIRLKSLAEESYNSKNLKSAVKYAKRAHKLRPSLTGLAELLAALRVIETAASDATDLPDWYRIMDVERFSNINTIKKQYRKLALVLHPDKSSGAACEEAFKLVGEAMRVLSDKIRRKEYDMRLRIAMQAEVEAEAVTVAEVVETFRAACSSCSSLHHFERKYLGHNLMCPSCKDSFVAVEEGSEDEGSVGDEEVLARVSARIREKNGRGGKTGEGKRKLCSVGDVIERSGVKIARSADEVGVSLKDLGFKTVEKTGGSDNGAVKVYQSRRMRKTMNPCSNEFPGSSNNDVENESVLMEVGRGDRDEFDEEKDSSGGTEIAQSERAKRTKTMDEETMTLAQMQMLARKRKLDKGKLMVKENEVNQNLTPKKKEEVKGKEKKNEKEKAKANKIEKEKDDGERETEDVTNLESEDDLDIMLVEMEKGKEKEKDNNIEREKEKQKGKEKESGKESEEMEKDSRRKGNEIETVNVKERRHLRRVSKNWNSEVENGTSDKHLNVEIESDLEPIEKDREKEDDEKETQKPIANTREKRERRRVSKYSNLPTSKDRNLNVEIESDLEPIEKDREKEDDEKETQKPIANTREKRERRRVSKYSNLPNSKDRNRISENHIDSEIERLRSLKKSNLEIMQVEDSDFHDFDKDRRERSFKNGQVWALYDEDDGMPRHYALINRVISVNPFQVTLSWLQFQSNGDEELISWEKMGFHFSCGRFKVSKEVSVKYLNLFSHIADCERIARELYMIYPRKGSVWALYNDNVLDSNGRNKGIKDKRCYDIVVSLSSYSEIHGLSVAYLEKADGFRTVFKRKEIGAHAVIWLSKEDMKLFSHQIPAKKLSGEESLGLPKNCWELDPASLTLQLL